MVNNHFRTFHYCCESRYCAGNRKIVSLVLVDVNLERFSDLYGGIMRYLSRSYLSWRCVLPDERGDYFFGSLLTTLFMENGV
jgi:hypothetical protein